MAQHLEEMQWHWLAPTMTNFTSNPEIGDIVKLSGKMRRYRCTRASASFVFTKNDQHKMGIIAVGAALAGLSGQAASVAEYASDMEETADYLEFEMASLPVKGWVWRSPFREGDVVDVAAEWNGEYYEAYGVARPDDQTIALYPHCSRGSGRHVKNAVKWWAIWNIAFFTPLVGFLLNLGGLELISDPAFFWLTAGTAVIWILVFISLTRQFMPFVRLSEKIFLVLGLADPANVDLVASSKKLRTGADTPEFGTFYLRY